MNNKPYFTLLWVISLTIAGVFVLVGISLVPHFADIGLAATVMLYIFMGYATIAGGGFLAFKLYQWWNYRNLLTHGEVVAYRNGKRFEHLSAEHERAKVPLPPVTVKELPQASTDERILELYDKGTSLRAIERLLKDEGVTYYAIQQCVSTHRPAVK